MAADAKDFQFPPFYNLPPFFTLQPNATVRAKQMELWTQFVCDYCRFHRVFMLDISEASAIFKNAEIQRQLAGDAHPPGRGQVGRLGQAEVVADQDRLAALARQGEIVAAPTEVGRRQKPAERHLDLAGPRCGFARGRLALSRLALNRLALNRLKDDRVPGLSPFPPGTAESARDRSLARGPITTSCKKPTVAHC